ncbi:hypothetical protein GEMRC1_011417 [Eukaryota sp. GEM-RC1]
MPLHHCRRLTTTTTVRAKTAGRSQIDVASSAPLSPTSLSIRAKEALGVSMTPSKALRAVREQESLLFGNADESYGLLEHYISALRESDSSHCVHLEHKKNSQGLNEFDRIFWAYGPSIEGFQAL